MRGIKLTELYELMFHLAHPMNELNPLITQI